MSLKLTVLGLILLSLQGNGQYLYGPLYYELKFYPPSVLGINSQSSNRHPDYSNIPYALRQWAGNTGSQGSQQTLYGPHLLAGFPPEALMGDGKFPARYPPPITGTYPPYFWEH